MKSFHLKSVLLGIGIGIILTSLISMIYSAGFNPNNVKLSDQEIIEKAKSLGMLEANSGLISSGISDTKLESDGTDTSSSTKTKNEGTTQKVSTNSQNTVSTQSPTSLQPVQTEPDVMIEVVKGDTSEMVGEKLFKAKLIADKKAFIDELTIMGLTMEINIGQYKIKKDTNIRDIIKSLTTAK